VTNYFRLRDAFGALLVSTVGLVLVVGIVFASSFLESLSDVNIWAASLGWQFLIIIMVLVFARRRGSVFSTLRLNKTPNIQVVFLGLGLAYLVLISYLLLIVALEAMLDLDLSSFKRGNAIPLPGPEGRSFIAWMLLAVTAICGAPVAEELLYRGVIFQGFASNWPNWIAHSLSAALFSITHLDIGVVIPIFGIGIIFSIIFAREKSLWAPIGIHALFNTVGFLAMFISEV